MADTNSKLPFLEIIEWVEPDPNLLMWKVPDQDKEIKNGAKLIVRESQTALFLNEGVAADVFPAGTHELSTKNIPILSKLKGWKYGFESPFKSEMGNTGACSDERSAVWAGSGKGFWFV